MDIEFATLRGEAPGQHPAVRAPRHIRDAINRARHARGLPPINEIEDRVALAPEPAPPAGPGVWIDPASRLAPRGVRPASNGYFRASDCTLTTTRVWLFPMTGTARARSIGRSRDERIVRGALGMAADWNAGGWLLRDDHGGMPLAAAGPWLRAVDTPVGIAVEWIPDMGRADHADALRRLEAGHGCSLCFTAAERVTGNGADLVTRGRMLHIAIVDRPAYAGAIARVYRDRPAGPAERQRQLVEATAAATRAADAGRA